MSFNKTIYDTFIKYKRYKTLNKENFILHNENYKIELNNLWIKLIEINLKTVVKLILHVINLNEFNERQT